MLVSASAVIGDDDSAGGEDAADPVASVKEMDVLVPRSKITPLIQSKSNIQGIAQVTWHFALLGILAYCVFHPTTNSTIKWLSILMLAFVSSFFFHGMHECVHRTAFASKWLNDAFAHIFGFLCGRPACHYRYYHWQHHKYTGSQELDSELQPGSFLDLPIDSVATYLAYLSGLPFWLDAVSSLFRHARGRCPEVYLNNNKACQQVIREARIYLSLYGVLAVLGFAFRRVIGNTLMHLWLLPAILGQPFLRFYLLAEHRGRLQTPYIYENTRTMQTNWFYRKLAYSMPFHMEHHAWPSVPFYRLKDAHELLDKASRSQGINLGQGDLIDSSAGNNGYVIFHLSYLKNLLLRSRKK
jgi:fatty acid desaturase